MASEHTTLQDDIRRNLGIGGPRSRRLRPMVIGTVVLLAVALAMGWRLSRSNGAPVYEGAPVTRGDLTVTVSATGTLQPTDTVDVGIEVSGTIASVAVDYNDRVKVGQVLARLDTTKLDAQVAQTEASLKSAQAKVLQAAATVAEVKLKLDRLRELKATSTDGYVSQQDVDSAQADYDRARADVASAEAQVAQMQATLKSNRNDLAKAVIRSPIDGIVLARSVDPGQTVAASFQAPTLFTLAEDLSQMELQADIDEADVGQVHEGQTATFTVDAYPNRHFPARIKQLRYGSETVDNVVTYKAILEVDNGDLALRPGMTATATIVVQQIKDALLVPNRALRYVPPQTAGATTSGRGLLGSLLPHPPAQRSATAVTAGGNQQRVWILVKGQPAAVPVTTGPSDGIHTVITGGALAVGAEVITDSRAAG